MSDPTIPPTNGRCLRPHPQPQTSLPQQTRPLGQGVPPPLRPRVNTSSGSTTIVLPTTFLVHNGPDILSYQVLIKVDTMLARPFGLHSPAGLRPGLIPIDRQPYPTPLPASSPRE